MGPILEFIIWLIFSKYSFQKIISYFHDLKQDLRCAFVLESISLSLVYVCLFLQKKKKKDFENG